MRHLIVTLCIFTPAIALAHGGGLDASGCHHNHKTGDYHCHRAPATQGQTLQPQQGSGNAMRPHPSRPSQAADATCHVGPRGGTYTITPSGRKNYNGC